MNGDGDLPILVKLIDARKDLSVQVHPTDEYARVYENGQRGKTEMWYVLDAARDASLVYGFCHDISKEKLRQSIQDCSIEKYLQKVRVRKNDVFYIESGTVHAIGAGVLIAEIQESSNLTYRLYDYGRLDKNGQLRQLHIDKALDVANLRASSEPRQPMRVLRFAPGYAMELLGRNRYFQVERMLLNTERIRTMAQISTQSNSFAVMLCVDGCGAMMWDGEMMPFFRGDCIFFPADSVKVKIHGKATLLKIGC
jgi:mannose-6-phosphate isomerase